MLFADVLFSAGGFFRNLCCMAMVFGFTMQNSAPAQESPAAGFKPLMMEVIVAEAPIKDGESELSKVRDRDRLWVFKLDESKQWAYVKIPGSEQKGWILLTHLGERRFPESARPDVARLRNLEKQGYALKSKEQNVEARPLLLEALAIRERLDPGSSELAFLLRAIGQTLQREDPAESRSYLERYVSVMRELQGKTGANFQIAVNTYVDALSASGELDESIAMLEGLLGVNAVTFDDAALDMADIRSKLMTLYRAAEGDFARNQGGRLYTKMAAFLRQAVERSTVLNGRVHPVTIGSLNSLGLILTYLRDFKEAEHVLNESLEMLSRPDVASEAAHSKLRFAVLNNLALVYENTSRLDKASLALRDSLTLGREVSGNDTRRLITILDNLARVLRKTGVNSEAEIVLLEELELCRKTFGNENMETAKCLYAIGEHYLRTSEFGHSLRHFSESLQIRERVAGADHTLTIQALQSMARVHLRLGSLNQAEQLAKDALARSANAGEASQRQSIWARNTILEILTTRDDFDHGISFGEETLKLCEHQFGKESQNYIDASNILAVLYIRAGRHAEAGTLLQSQTATIRRLYETDPSQAAARSLFNSLNNLGMNLVASGHPNEAIALMTEAGQMTEKFEQSSSGEVVKNLLLLNNAYVRFAVGDEAGACRLIQEYRQAERSYAAQVLPGLPQDSVDDYLATAFLPNLARCLSLAYHRPDDGLLATLSAGWLINGKAVGQEAIAEGALINSPETTLKVRELRDVRSRLSQLASFVQSDPDWRKEQIEQIAELESREQTLTTDIARHGLGLNQSNPWVSTGQLQEKLPFDAVLVNIARIRVNNFATNQDKYSWSNERYVAWIIPSVGSPQPIRVIDLGEAEAIDGAVATVRKQLTASIPLIREQGESAAEQSLQESLTSLSRMLLDPLMPYLTDSKELIVSPDSELWLLPWEILRTAKETYLVEEYRIRYILSGRELVLQPIKRAVVTEPIIFADPDFDHMLAASEDTDALSPESQDSTRSFNRPGKFSRLPGTALEAAAIRPALETYTGQTVELVTSRDASDVRFKQLSRPRVLVLSTHGFFLSEPPATNSQDQPSAGTIGNGRVFNPLLRCGLALAGCNQPGAAGAVDDGILTGLEIVGTDLRGTELVVLSACETGVGDVRNGEGVAGLRQAFQLAGAESVVSTLWQIPDQETARLMSDLFVNLTEGMNKSAALRTAQLTRITARRERFGAAHPFFWAAFTLTGQE